MLGSGLNGNERRACVRFTALLLTGNEAAIWFDISVRSP